jgi:hypothetical protein
MPKPAGPFGQRASTATRVRTRALCQSSHSCGWASSDSACGYSLSEHANDDGLVWDGRD